MKIESVRQLKQECREQVLSPLTIDGLNRRRLGVRAVGAFRQKGPVRPKTVALGISMGNGGSEGYRLAIRVQHPRLWAAPEVHAMHDKARGETDIRFVGSVYPLQAPWYQKPCNPLQIGCSIGHYQITAGTLGGFVQDRLTGATLILSNNHVLAAVNQGKAGDDILQPGQYDDGRDPENAVASLRGFKEINFDEPNLIDGAVADITGTVDFDARSLDVLGKLSGGRTTPFASAESVYKFGRTTGPTKGVVTAIEVDNIAVTYDDRMAVFDDQIEVQGIPGYPFAAGGDSGSLVVDENKLAIGLLFGGNLQDGSNNPGLVYVNHLDNVLNQLNVDLLW